MDFFTTTRSRITPLQVGTSHRARVLANYVDSDLKREVQKEILIRFLFH